MDSLLPQVVFLLISRGGFQLKLTSSDSRDKTTYYLDRYEIPMCVANSAISYSKPSNNSNAEFFFSIKIKKSFIFFLRERRIKLI